MQGVELRALRKDAGITQGDLALRAGMTLGYIGELERGEKRIERRTEAVLRLVLEGPEIERGLALIAAASPDDQAKLDSVKQWLGDRLASFMTDAG